MQPSSNPSQPNDQSAGNAGKGPSRKDDPFQALEFDMLARAARERSNFPQSVQTVLAEKYSKSIPDISAKARRAFEQTLVDMQSQVQNVQDEIVGRAAFEGSLTSLLRQEVELKHILQLSGSALWSVGEYKPPKPQLKGEALFKDVLEALRDQKQEEADRNAKNLSYWKRLALKISPKIVGVIYDPNFVQEFDQAGSRSAGAREFTYSCMWSKRLNEWERDSPPFSMARIFERAEASVKAQYWKHLDPIVCRTPELPEVEGMTPLETPATWFFAPIKYGELRLGSVCVICPDSTGIQDMIAAGFDPKTRIAAEYFGRFSQIAVSIGEGFAHLHRISKRM